MSELFVFSSSTAFFWPSKESFIWPLRLVLTQIQLSVLYLRVISLQVILGGILLWLCARNYALHGQNPGLKTQLLHEFLDTSLISSACVLCQECQLLFFQTESPSFSTTQHTHAHTHMCTCVCACILGCPPRAAPRWLLLDFLLLALCCLPSRVLPHVLLLDFKSSNNCFLESDLLL